jgi:hypothetical protein
VVTAVAVADPIAIEAVGLDMMKEDGGGTCYGMDECEINISDQIVTILCSHKSDLHLAPVPLKLNIYYYYVPSRKHA